MKGFILTLGEIISLIEDNKKQIKPKYSDIYFEVNYEIQTDSLDIFIPTKQVFRKFPVKSKKLKQIMELFDAIEVSYVEQMDDDGHAFWSVKVR